MTTLARLAAFGAALAVTFGASAALGSALSSTRDDGAPGQLPIQTHTSHATHEGQP